MPRSLRRVHSDLLTFVVAAALLAPTHATAQCSFDRPLGSSSYTAYISTSLVQAFVSCGNPAGNAPNTTTAGGVPTCQPVETFNQQGGSPADGWRFQQGSSYGRIKVQRTSVGGNLPGFPHVSRDVQVSVKLYHIVESDGHTRANGTGFVQLILRVTTDDYANGDMTVIDFPLGFPIHVAGGNVSTTAKVGDLLLGIGQPRFPDCSSFEVVSMAVQDPNGNIFAVPGLRNP